jgi:predicted NACHT family NTPase
MAKRSLKASQEGITRAKRAFDLRGWTQEYLAAEVGLQTRQSIWKFFSGRPVERHIFIDICFTLDLDWEDIVDRSAFVTDAPELPTQTTETVAPSMVEKTTEDLAEARSHLITLAQAQCQLLELPLDLHHPLTLAQLYTEAYVRSYQRLGQSASVAKTPAVEAIQAHSRVLVVGGPGAGKTTLLQHLALTLGENCLRDNGHTSLPVFLRLRQLALLSEQTLNLRQHLDQRWLASGLCQAQIDRLWQQGQLWLLLDGWDELPAERHRLVTQQIQALLDTHPGLRVLISGRSGGPMPQLNGLVTLELTEFAPQQVETFVHKWFTASQPEPANTLAQSFLETLHHPDNDRLREMALTPMLLHLMCLVFNRFGQFPEHRSKLYQQALDLLLGQWDQQRGIDRTLPLQRLSHLDLTGILCEVATRSFEQERLVLEEAELLGLIAKSLVNRGAENETLERLWADGKAILQALIEHYGMLTERELGSYAFAHLSFQEYLTARSWAITALERPHPEDWQDLACQLGDPRWREVILLTVEMVPDPAPLWEALWHQSQGYVRNHPELATLLDWAQCRAEVVPEDYHPAALRGFYLGLRMEQGIDLATAIDARLAVDLPPSLALDQALIHLLHQARHWLDDPTLQSGFDLALGMDLGQRFGLADDFARALYQLQTQLLTALEQNAQLTNWCASQGEGWLQTLQQTVTTHRRWDGPWHDNLPPGLQTYYQMQRLLVNCLHHNRLFTAQVMQTFERALLVREVQYEPA